MTLVAGSLTPQVLLSAPRRSAGAPNSSGTKALYTVTTYSFETHKKTSQFRVLDIESGNSSVVYEDAAYSEPSWVSDDKFVFIKSGDKGSSSLVLGDISGSSPKEIQSFDASISNLKIKKLPDGTFAVAVSSLATPKGHLANPETEKKSYSSAKVYTSLFVRHWDAWKTENENAIWYGSLKLHDDAYTLAEPGLVNVLAGTGLISPVPPFGGTGDFDIGPQGIVFVAKDPELDPAMYTKTDLYFVPLKSFAQSDPPKPQLVKTGTLRGYSLNPVFSNAGDKVAFARMRSWQYESDKPRLLLIPDLSDLTNVQEFYQTDDGEGGWDSKPDAIAWSHDDSELFVTAEDKARVKLWKLPSDPARAAGKLPVPLTGEGSVSDFRLLADGSSKLFVSSSSLVDSSRYSILDTTKASEDGIGQVVSSNFKHGKTLGLDRAVQLTDIWSPGAGDYKVHSLVTRPSGFDASKKYPLAFFVHGGPQGAWQDSWSTRWNPAVFAEQGYVVVSPNPTGSTGYGMSLQDGITGDWGGRPYQDLVKVFEYIKENLDYVDTNRAVALGASYGGYMINWIQGHPLGREFKALVCHDGVFSTLNQWETEELFFPIHDFEGTLEENRPTYEKWDPAKFISEWATPQLIIHSELDYRLPVTEGLAPFNVLQAKGIPSKLLVFPDENHWVLKPENSLVWHKEVIGWVNKYAGVDSSSLESETKDLKI